MIKKISLSLDEAIEDLKIKKLALDEAIFKCIAARDQYTEAVYKAEEIRHQLELELSKAFTVTRTKALADKKLEDTALATKAAIKKALKEDYKHGI